MSAPRRRLGPLSVSPMGIAPSYGLDARGVEMAFERGIDFFFWGALRRRAFARGLRSIERTGAVTIAVQSFSRRPLLLRGSIELARRQLRRDVLDLVILGYWDQPPPPAIVDVVEEAKGRGTVRAIGVSSHRRTTLAALARDPRWDVLMLRYNAAHLGAETEVLSSLDDPAPGVLAYTATRWGTLLDGDGLREPPLSATECYRFALSHPRVTCCLAAPKNEEELQSALAANELGPLDAEELERARRVGAAVRARSRGVAPTTWRDGLAHARGIVRELRERGITEDLISRFNR